MKPTPILTIAFMLLLCAWGAVGLAVTYSGGGSNVDQSSGARVAIDYAHHEIHEGQSFTCSYDQTVTEDDYRTGISFTTSNTARWCHVTVHITTTDESMFYIYEGVTLDLDEGADLTVFNRDRNSALRSWIDNNDAFPTQGTATSWTEAAIALARLDTGTTLYSETLAVATGPAGKTVGGDSRGTQEFILRQNTKYLFLVQSTDADNNTHHIHVNWYEHQNR